jgi:DNA-binding transcriptional MerR regulator
MEVAKLTSELEKIDLIRARLGVSYKEAREALEKADGDVVQALVNLEEQGRNLGERFQARGQEMVGQVKEFLQKGQTYRIKVKKGDRTVYEFPATIGALGLIGALASSEIAVLGALGTVAAMANKYTLEFERQGERPEYENTSLGERPV